jgi:Ran GTPase-activating protein (RanGAP) involved in mRNA processing and transport
MDRHLSWKYIYHQRKHQKSGPILVGDLPLKRQDDLYNVLNPPSASNSTSLPPVQRLLYFSQNWTHRRTARDLETLQILLHLEGQEEREINLVGGRNNWSDEQTCFHEEIRANWEQFAGVVGDKDQLEDLEIKNIAIPPSPFFAEKMVPSLQKPSLVRLDLINCNLTSGDFESVAQLLKKLPALISLGLSRNEMGASDAKSLSAAIAKHKTLSFVDLSKCGLNKSEDILPLILKGSKKLNGLDLSGNKFETESLMLIAKFLSTHKAITVLNLGGMKFDSESVTAFNKAVEKNKTLEEVSVASTEITLSTSIQRSLVLNDKLLHIDLSFNKLLMDAQRRIIKHVKRNPPLSILTLDGCGLSNKCAEGLCNALKRNTNLAHLDIEYNNFNDKSVPFFVDALRNNSTLLTLQMSGNKLKVQGGRKELIKGALCDSTSLQTIAESNHTCLVTLNSGNNGNYATHENEFRNINALDNEGQKIRYKVIAALYTLKTIELKQCDFQHVPLELMPRLIELVQQQMGYGKYGREVWKAPIRAKGSNPRLTRVYEVVHGWSMMPSLFAVSYYHHSYVCHHFVDIIMCPNYFVALYHLFYKQRGPGKKKKKAAKKRKHAFAFNEADDEEWTPRSKY